MNEEHPVDSDANLSMPRYEEVREQILNHSYHDLQQSDLSAELGVEIHDENTYHIQEDGISNEIDTFIKHLVLLNFNHDKILDAISCFEEFRENPPLDNLFFLHIFLFKLSTLQQQNQDFDTPLDKNIYTPINLLPDTQFPWPISEMAQFEFNNSDHLITLDRVIVIIGLPKTNDVKLLQVAHELLYAFLFTELAYVLSVNIPCKEDGVSTGCAFIEFGSFLEISIICKAIEGFKFGDGVLHCRPFSDLSSGSDLMNEDELIRLRRESIGEEEGEEIDLDLSDNNNLLNTHISPSPINTPNTDILIQQIGVLPDINNNNINTSSITSSMVDAMVNPPPPSSNGENDGNTSNTSVTLESLTNEVQKLQIMNQSISIKLDTITNRYSELENNNRIICQRNKHLTDKNQTLIESIDHLKHTLRLITASRDQMSSRYGELSRDLDSARSALLRSSRLVDSKENELLNLKATNEKLREEIADLTRPNRNRELEESVETMRKLTLDNLKVMSVKDLSSFSDVLEEFVLNLRKAKDFAVEREKSETQSKLDEIVCVICQKNNKNVLLLPCKHFCICEECSNNEEFNNKCPICRSPIIDKMIIYS